MKIKGKKFNYNIKKSNNGFYIECKSRNIFTLFKEYFTDFVGLTYIHPIYLDNKYHENINQAISSVHNDINNEGKSHNNFSIH